MAADPYKMLGVSRTASEAEIKSAYRKLAKKYHPDLNAGNDVKFKELNSAHDVLADPTKRAAFDRGEIDGSGEPTRPQYTRQPGSGPARPGTHSGNFDFGNFGDLDDLFSAFGGGKSRSQRRAAPVDHDVHYKVEVDFMEAARGGKNALPCRTENRSTLPFPKALPTGKNSD